MTTKELFTNTFDALKERRKDFKKFDDVSTKDRMDAMLIDADEKLKLGMIRESELGNTTPEQDKEVALLLPRVPMLSEAIMMFEEAQYRGYDKPFEMFYDDLKNGDFKGLMIDPRDFMSLMNKVPRPLAEPDFNDISFADVITEVRQGIGALFKKHDKKEYGVSVA